MLVHLILNFLFTFSLTRAQLNNTAKPGCPTACGNITVPYPFGIGSDCSLDRTFNLSCNTSDPEHPKLFVGSLEIYDISDSELHIFTLITYNCYDQSGLIDNKAIGWTNLAGFYTFSTKNKFTVIGCDDYALFAGTNEDKFYSACFGLCREAPNVRSGQCSGIGCCQIPISKGLSYYNVSLQTLKSHSDVWSFNQCGYSFLVEEGRFEFGGATDLSSNHKEFVDRITSTMPVVLDWVITPDGNCTAGVNECKGNSSCYDVDGDIDECKDIVTNSCYGYCINTIGSYNCTCQQGFFGDAKIINGCIAAPKHSKPLSTIIITVVSVSMGAFFLIAIIVLYKVIKKTKEERQRKRFFTCNGGLLLKQQQEADPSLVDKTILFTSSELEKATEKFNENRILGRGGHGTVYKGMLVDGKIVAVKKSTIVDKES